MPPAAEQQQSVARSIAKLNVGAAQARVRQPSMPSASIVSCARMASPCSAGQCQPECTGVRWQGRRLHEQPALVFRRLQVPLRERRTFAGDVRAELMRRGGNELGRHHHRV